MDFETVIVGSGAAGVAAAMELDRQGTAIIDVGETPSQIFSWDSLRSAKESGDINQLLGTHWEMLSNIKAPSRHSKLRAEQIRYVDSGEPYSAENKAGKVLNTGRGSYARGGFTNAWGAQAYRYTQKDLDILGDWPITINDLESYYKKIEKHIGVSGFSDDLNDFLGPPENLLPPPRITPCTSGLLSRYRDKKTIINKMGLTLGYPRLALLTTKHHAYPPHEFGETEFFDTRNPSTYTPQRTLDELIARGNVKYLSQLRLDSYTEVTDGVDLVLTHVVSGERINCKAKRVLLACGALHSSRLVLLNNKRQKRSLPLLEHPPTLVPLIMPRFIATTLPDRSFPVQLAGCFEYQGEKQMVSVYYAGGMLRSDFVSDLPFSMSDNLWVLNGILPGLLVLQIWGQAKPNPKNRFRLNDDARMVLEYPVHDGCRGVKTLLKAMRKIGVYGHEKFIQKSPVGWGFHFAGMLPMANMPGEFETDRFGLLWNCKRVHVIDGSVLPSLPAKNLTLTIMANAARIAASLAKC